MDQLHANHSAAANHQYLHLPAPAPRFPADLPWTWRAGKPVCGPVCRVGQGLDKIAGNAAPDPAGQRPLFCRQAGCNCGKSGTVTDRRIRPKLKQRRRFDMRLKKVASACFASLFVLATLPVIPAEASSLKQRCQNAARKYADDKVAGNVVGGALIGAGIGLGIGAIAGGHKSAAIGAGIGAGTGAVGGGIRGSDRWNHYYNKKYYKCMNG
jgi:uncharacterized membrane protein